jgi:hypothetical protein
MAMVVVPIVIALIAVAAGVCFILYAAGFFNYLGGKKCDPTAVNKEILMKKLLDLNDQNKPYQIVKGEDTDLLAEWKFVDSKWYGLFNKNGLRSAYRARLLLDEARHSVRCFEELGSVSWTAGDGGLIPSIHFQKSHFGGRILFQNNWGVGYGGKQLSHPELGKVYEYKFDIDEIRGPIVDTVKENGWEWVPVTARRHTTY